MVILSTLFIYFLVFPKTWCINETKNFQKGDYHKNNYDTYYSLNPDNETIDLNSLIIPIPIHFNPRYGVEAPEIELPDDSLADVDLKDHDFIDNLMYVYFEKDKGDINHGETILLIGTGVSSVIEFVTMVSASMHQKLKFGIQKGAKIMFLYWLICLFFSNILFMMNLYVNMPIYSCEFTSLLFYYLHIVIASSLFIYTLWIKNVLRNSKYSRVKFLIFLEHVFALILYLVSLLFSCTQNVRPICYISIQRETIFEYTVPICILIFATTFFSLNGIRRVNLELSDLGYDSTDFQVKHIESGIFDPVVEHRIYTLKEFKKLLKVLCVTQCFYEIVWFISVLAIENLNENNLAAITYGNCYIFWKRKVFLPPACENSYNDGVKGAGKIIDVVSDGLLADDIPLLMDIESDVDIAEIKTDYIDDAITN
ncbi:uncharacterized protein [Onthophagus taurus]|uniref:uncharacterized protein isoform X2 n=1 Tax=Onthophagus taurus TaxID=166361 RepID=UPI0039BE79FC